jgi:hypothetical protein
VVQLHQKRPPCLFSPPHLELSACLSALHPAESKLLQEYLEVSDLSGPFPSGSKADKVLDLLEILWLTQSLKVI